MFETAQMLYLYVETPLHAGTGSSVGVVDLPIQRERHTKYPMIQSSGIKGKLRAEACEKLEKKDDKHRDKKIKIIFGDDSLGGSKYAGAISPGDARLLLFPVRSLVGVFAWTTSIHALARFKRDLEAAGKTVEWNLDNLSDHDKAWTVDAVSVCAGDKVVLEEFAYVHRQHEDVETIAKWLAENALPQAPTDPAKADEYSYFRDKLKKHLVILPETDFRDFTQFATEVVTRIKIDQEKKTVQDGALWTEEHLPSDTLLYTPLHATRPRETSELFDSAEDILKEVRTLGLDRLQLGGDETVGRGIVKLHFGGN